MNNFYPKASKHGIEVIDIGRYGITIQRSGIRRHYNRSNKRVQLLFKHTEGWTTTFDFPYCEITAE